MHTRDGTTTIDERPVHSPLIPKTPAALMDGKKQQ